MKNNLKILFGVLAMCLASLFYSCQDDSHEHEDHTHGSDLRFNYQHFNYFKNLPSLMEKALPKQNDILYRNGTGDFYDFDIDSTNVLEILSGQEKYYTMAILREPGMAKGIENLVICDRDTVQEAYVVTYFPDAEYYEKADAGMHAPYTGGISLTHLDYNKLYGKGNTICNTLVIPTCSYDGAVHIAGAGCTKIDGEVSISLCVTFVPEKSIETAEVVIGAGEMGGGGSGGGSGGDGDGDGNPPNPFIVNPTNPRVITNPMVPTKSAANVFKNSLSVQQQQFLDANNQINTLINNYFEQGSQSDISKKDVALEMLNIMMELGIPEQEEIDAMAMTFIGHGNGYFNNPHDENYFTQIDQYTEADMASPTHWPAWQAHFSAKCAILKYQNPSWSKARVYWEASLETIHLGLDIVGLVPVVGEVADLTNGLIYAIEGDGINAAISTAAAIPFVGWGATGAKLAQRTVILFDGSYTTLKWLKNTQNLITFGNRGQLRKMMGLAVGDPRQAHHIIPWGEWNHRAVQKAAGSTDAFHMNEAFNGIALDNVIHNGSHHAYNNKVRTRLNAISENASPEETYDAIMEILHDIRTAIYNNPTTNINNINF